MHGLCVAAPRGWAAERCSPGRGGVDHGLDAQRPAVFEVLLDPRVLVEDVDDHALHVAAVDGGPEGAGGVAADLAAEDDLHVAGAADVEVVSDQRLEEPTGVAGSVEHQGAGYLDLPHRALPPVAGIAVALAQGQRQQRQPPLGEHVEVARSQPVTDGLQRGGVIAGREPVGQLGKADPGAGSLALDPLVPVDPDLGRVRKVGAHLDERRAEVAVPQVAGSSR